MTLALQSPQVPNHRLDSGLAERPEWRHAGSGLPIANDARKGRIRESLSGAPVRNIGAPLRALAVKSVAGGASGREYPLPIY